MDDLEDFLEAIDVFGNAIHNAVIRIPKRYVRDRFNPLEENWRKKGLPLPPITQLIASLRFYASASYQEIIADLHYVSQASICLSIQRVSVALASRFNDFVHFPPDDEGQVNNIKKFFLVSGMVSVAALIDGVLIRIRSPPREFAELFRCRKGYFAINVLAVVGPNGEFLYVDVRHPGSVHNKTSLDRSVLRLWFAGEMITGELLGDNGYALTTNEAESLAHVSVLRNDVRIGVGVIVTSEFVALPWSIIQDIPIEEIRILTYPNGTDNDPALSRIKAKQPHLNYEVKKFAGNFSKPIHDIALIQVEQKFNFNDTLISSADMPSQSYQIPNETIVSLYGYNNIQESVHLIGIANTDNCAEFLDYGGLYEGEICVQIMDKDDPEYSVSLCQGEDEGSFRAERTYFPSKLSVRTHGKDVLFTRNPHLATTFQDLGIINSRSSETSLHEVIYFDHKMEVILHDRKLQKSSYK
ncbi:hypothetical protein QAD02_001088 [Eretmocerus hayati]|uniref:Uncharacterized protein n=1 Tax=Eretmocerus hayati TaxID=131215 RepID=A0ACC2NHL4_9HYME|nr:hypothetical protein QAD02_001088 [Eretmocerus hayati]